MPLVTRGASSLALGRLAGLSIGASRPARNVSPGLRLATQLATHSPYGAYPAGYQFPGVVALAIKDGGMASHERTRGNASSVAAIKGNGRLQGALTAAASTFAHAVAVRNIYAVVTGAASTTAGIKGRTRMTSSLRIGATPTADENALTLLTGVPIEGGLTLVQLLRILLAHAAGDATGLDTASMAFKSLDGAKNRIAGTIAAGTRTVGTRDGT